VPSISSRYLIDDVYFYKYRYLFILHIFISNNLATEVEVKVMNKLSDMIIDINNGLDPSILASWYKKIEEEVKQICPARLRGSIAVIQDPLLPMKFELKSSKRAVPFIIEVIEDFLTQMPFATRLYFQKLEEIIIKESQSYQRKVN